MIGSNFISKSETNKIIKEIIQQWKIETPKIKNLKRSNIEKYTILSFNDFCVIKIIDLFVPCLRSINLLKKFPYVKIDMRAIKFVCNGADIMRPGIINYAEFDKNKIVCIKEEKHDNFLAIGKSLVDSNEIKNMEKGKIIKNLHYIGDRFWTK